MKKILLVCTLLLSMFAVTGCNKAPENQADMSTYSALTDKDHVYVKENLTDLYEDITTTKETYLLYIGFTNCPWCQELVPVLNEVAKENSLSVYYVDINSLSSEENNTLDSLKAYLSDWLYKENGESVLYVPDVAFIKDGQLVGNHIGTVSGHDAYAEKMTDEQKAELKQQLQDLIDGKTENTVKIENELNLKVATDTYEMLDDETKNKLNFDTYEVFSVTLQEAYGEIYDESYIGKDVYVVSFIYQENVNDSYNIFVSKETNEIVGLDESILDTVETQEAE